MVGKHMLYVEFFHVLYNSREKKLANRLLKDVDITGAVIQAVRQFTYMHN